METIFVSSIHSISPFATNLSFPPRWCHSPCPHHVYLGHLSSRDLDHLGSWSDRDHDAHSLDRDGRLFSESSPHGHLGEKGMANDLHGEGTAPVDHQDHGHVRVHVRNRIAKMQKGEFEPTVCFV